MNTNVVVKNDGLVNLEAKRKTRGWFRLSPWTAVSYAILVVLAAAYLGPLAMLVNTSFLTQREFNRNATAIPEAFTLDNYRETLDESLEAGEDASFLQYLRNTVFANFFEAWEEANFLQYMGNSILYATSATLVYVVTAVFLAFPIARGYIRGGNLIFILFVIALFLPPALIPQFQLILNLGLYNTRVGYIMLLVTNPIGIIILVGYLRSLPRELDEAAAMDGCGYVRFMVSIIFPLARPVIATVVVLHAIGIWNELILATIYLTDEGFYPITRGMIVFQGVYGFNWPVLAAGVVLMAIPMVVLFLFLQRYIISGLTQGAVKA